MKITTREQLEQVRAECRSMVTKRSMFAGAASAVPGAIAGVAADVAILLQLLPKINNEFGLDPEQIDELDEQSRQQMLALLKTVGSQIVGKVITKDIVLSVTRAVGVRMTAKAAISWVPIIGNAVGGVLGFGMMKYVGNQHVDECYAIVKKMLALREAEIA